ncbi:MAG: aldo/keto reductase [Acidobacteriota bacterium]
MHYRSFGNTGLQVSEISLGTAEIGMDYGFRGTRHYRRPDVHEAIYLIHAALDLGINLLDTARSYGDSERLIGLALKESASKPYIVSKVFVPPEALQMKSSALRQQIFLSIETSLGQLGTDTLDVLLIHNTSAEHLLHSEVAECLREAQREGKVRFFGASCYDEEVSLEAIRIPGVRALQVPFNILDQKARHLVLPMAGNEGVATFVRSAYLRGILTDQIVHVPERLSPLRLQAERVLEAVDHSSSLAAVALRFCLSYSTVSSVVMGVKSAQELRSNLRDAEAGGLPSDVLATLEELSMEESPLVDPRNWQDLI